MVKAITLLRLNPSVGPEVVCNFPKMCLEPSSRESAACEMEQVCDENFFSRHIESERVTSVNFAFSIPSRWSREDRERLMVSLLLNEDEVDPESDKIQPKLRKFATRLSKMEDAFKAFYGRQIYTFPKEERPNIREKGTSVEDLVKDLFTDTESVLKEVNMTL